MEDLKMEEALAATKVSKSNEILSKTCNFFIFFDRLGYEWMNMTSNIQFILFPALKKKLKKTQLRQKLRF